MSICSTLAWLGRSEVSLNTNREFSFFRFFWVASWWHHVRKNIPKSISTNKLPTVDASEILHHLVKTPMNNGIIILGGAGFCPSTGLSNSLPKGRCPCGGRTCWARRSYFWGIFFRSMVFWMVKLVGWVLCFTHLGDFQRGLDIIHLSGKITKYQPRFPWNKGIYRNLSYLSGWNNVWGRYTLTRVGRSCWNIIPTINALDGDFDSLIFLELRPRIQSWRIKLCFRILHPKNLYSWWWRANIRRGG